MLFNSYTFIAFFAVMLVLHHLPLPWMVKKINLLLGSYLFYAWANPPYILLLWLSTLVDYFVGKSLYAQQNSHKRKLLLALSLAGNLGMLCFFKYGTFLLDNFMLLAHALGIDWHPTQPNILLPAGISFYTFTTLCYTIDMYKRKSRPVESLLDFSLYVSFFPHLVAGPIVRPPQLAPQFETARRASAEQLKQGLLLFTIGLFFKVFLADAMLSGTANLVFGSVQRLRPLDAWAGVLAFSGQIFFDFAGYSTCAIGIALCLGFALPENFLCPYSATGFADFWRRWHVTLSAWLRDYVYIPLGGNRKGKISTYTNIFITMLLGGLWHGASWTFVAWGALHAVYLCVERAFRRGAPIKEYLPLPGFLRALLTFFFVSMAWVFFRAPGFASASAIFNTLMGHSPARPGLLPDADIERVGVIIALMLIVQALMRNRNTLRMAGKMSPWLLSIFWVVMIILVVLSYGSSNSFIYFRF